MRGANCYREKYLENSHRRIAISGLTPGSAQTIKLLGTNRSRSLRSNGCEFIRIRLDNPKPAAFIFDKKAFPTSGQANRGIFCRKDILYVAYPPIAQAEIMPIAQSTWNQQNQPQFSTNTIIATLSGGTWAASGTPVVINPPAASLNLPTVTGGGGVCCFVPSSSETPGVREGEFIFSCGV